MHLADLAARRSNCMKRRVGCVLVRAGRVISTGYNGTPRGVRNCNEGGCGRCNIGEGSGQSLSSCLCMHAEVYPRQSLILGKCAFGGGEGKSWDGGCFVL
jgi:dCMP deaminase